MNLRALPSLIVVITGLVPVVHGFGSGGGKGVEDRIKSGHGDRVP
jgi:hypothetical protein